MRAAAILGQIVLLLFLQVIDPLSCADGCRDHHDDAPSSDQCAGPDRGACYLCQGAVTPPRPAIVAGQIGVRIDRIVAEPLAPRFRPGPRLDHPPRLG